MWDYFYIEIVVLFETLSETALHDKVNIAFFLTESIHFFRKLTMAQNKQVEGEPSASLCECLHL